MSNARIHKYILTEISIPAFLSLLIFTFVLLMGKIPRLAELVINNGVPSGQILQLFSYLLPTFLSVTIPLSFLLGILLAFGRFSADSEFIALKASGVSLYNMVKPVFILAILFSLLTAWITISIEPASKTAFRSKLFQIASSNASVSVKAGVFNDEFDGLVLYARGVDENRGIMQDVFISDGREDETPAIITAQQGRFISNPNHYSLMLRLNNGSIHRRPTKEKKSTYQVIGFTSYDINLDIGSELDNKKRRRSKSELSWTELNNAIDQAKNTASISSLLVEKHERVVIAFAPLVLVLIGVPLGLQSQRSGKGAGFALALVVFLVYYVLLSFAGTLADKGILPAAIILWLPNVCFLLGGSCFLHSTATEKPFRLFSIPRQLLRQFRSQAKKDGGGS
ncbi:lipopolysaccharide export system permease protein [Desulfuromusa kysingii]|uniref:Lipopolysaccharide export system permease protein n=1 Tax=Desulfuromusa kysingii TaxID=37625 RepID=A0A1H3Y6U6_9BACT|nr:LPS export ABC transporter permease LptF [Desulfuromusa kysingii]SEA07399.1 lipopolysaccharide export system permease protein [Desulfuromusa kysingii]